MVTRTVCTFRAATGILNSPSMYARLRAAGDHEKALSGVTARQSIGRIGTPQEITSLALYLGSDESSFTTGQTHAIDGGWAI